MSDKKVKAKVKKANRLLKFPKKLLKIAATTVGMVFLQQAVVAAKISEDGYKPKDQIVEDAKLLGADLKIAEYGPIPIKLTRLKHNNGEPIYYYIGGDFSDKEKELINLSVEYFNNAFKVVNSKYEFKEAEQHQVILNGILGNSVFTVRRSYGGNFAGASLNRHNLANWNFIGGSTILLDGDSMRVHNSNIDWVYKENQGEFMRMFKEEFMHMLGIRDVYMNSKNKNPLLFGLNNTTDIVHLNTIMQNHDHLTIKSNDLSPNDFAVLNALYNENHIVDGTADANEFLKTQQIVNNYTKTYFKNRVPVISDYLTKISKERENLHLIKMNERVLKNTKISFNNVNDFVSDNFKAVAKYDHIISFNNNKLSYKILNSQTKQLVEEILTDYYFIDGVVFVSNAFFESGLIPGVSSRHNPGGGSVSDFSLVFTNSGYKLINMTHINRHHTFSKDAYKKAINDFNKLNKTKLSNENSIDFQFGGGVKIQSQIDKNYKFILPIDEEEKKR